MHDVTKLQHYDRGEGRRECCSFSPMLVTVHPHVAKQA